MKVIEKFLLGKTGTQELCEDELAITEDFVAIIDGMSCANFSLGGISGGKRSSLIARSIIEQFPVDITKEEAIKSINDAFLEEYHRRNLYEEAKENPQNRLGINIILYSRSSKELWICGDCQCMVDGRKYTFDKKVDTLIAEVRRFYLDALVANGVKEDKLKDKDESTDLVNTLISMQGYLQNSNSNSEYAYSVIDGFFSDYSKIDTVDVSRAKEIILASDGYPRLFDTLEKSEEYLKKSLLNDPLCYKIFKSTKGRTGNNKNFSYDDRGYIRISTI